MQFRVVDVSSFWTGPLKCSWSFMFLGVVCSSDNHFLGIANLSFSFCSSMHRSFAVKLSQHMEFLVLMPFGFWLASFEEIIEMLFGRPVQSTMFCQAFSVSMGS